MGAHESKNKDSENNKPPWPPGLTNSPGYWQSQWNELKSENKHLQEQMGIYINEYYRVLDKYYNNYNYNIIIICRMNEAHQENYLLKQENDELREKISDQVRKLCA